MKNLYKNTIAAIGISFCFYSCNNVKNKSEIQSITIDFEKYKVIDLADTSGIKIVPLETTENSLLTSIQHVEYLNDKMLVFARQVVAFDKNGKFLFNVGRKGQGPGEYSMLTNFFVKNGQIFLFDEPTQRILTYDESGNYLSSTRLHFQRSNLSVIYPIENQLFVAKNYYYRDETGCIPAVCILNEKYEKVQEIDNRCLTSRLITADNFCSFDDHILYWEHFNDTIFSVVEQKKIVPKYIVDFQEYKIPSDVQKSNDYVGLSKYFEESTETAKIATYSTYIHEDSAHIRLIFVQKENPTTFYVNYVRFNKESKKVELYRLLDSRNKLMPKLFMQYRDGVITIEAHIIDSEDNPVLVFINEKDYVE
jgi:hypothetical protein